MGGRITSVTLLDRDLVVTRHFVLLVIHHRLRETALAGVELRDESEWIER